MVKDVPAAANRLCDQHLLLLIRVDPESKSSMSGHSISPPFGMRYGTFVPKSTVLQTKESDSSPT
jgi:hypothetical protein